MEKNMKNVKTLGIKLTMEDLIKANSYLRKSK